MTHAEDALSTTLEAVVQRFATMVRSVGRRHRLSEPDLDAVMQEVRIRLWRACPTSEQLEAIGTSYVYRTAMSAALDILRRRRAYAAPLTDSVDEHSRLLTAGGRDAQRQLEDEELAARVLGAVEGIVASRRPVVRMYLAGYDREEIAELLGWTEGKTRNLLYRGLADLRTRLADEGLTLEQSDD